MSSLSPEQLTSYALSDDEDKRSPETPMELSLQRIWADVLKVPAGSIGRDSNFLRMGGDSIAAIYAATAAREAGILVTVNDMFDDPRLFVVATKAIQLDDVNSRALTVVEPFSLLSPSLQSWARGVELRSKCGLSSEQSVEDAFPCTTFQEGLLALSAKHPGLTLPSMFTDFLLTLTSISSSMPGRIPYGPAATCARELFLMPMVRPSKL